MDNFFEDFIKSINKEKREIKHVNLVVAGKTGVGKSTLINAAFEENIAKTGIGKPITDEVKLYEREGYPIRIYDTIGFELDEWKRIRSQNWIEQIYENADRDADSDNFIHAMWYCVASDTDKLEPYEVEYINELAEKMPVILVITKSFRKKHSQRLLDAIKANYNPLKIRNAVIVLAQDEDAEDCDEEEIPKKAFGVDTLVEMTAQVVPEGVQKAWCRVQKASINLKVDQAQKVVIATAAASFGEGFIPLPFSDAAALVPTQLGMMAGITTIFGVNVSASLLKAIVTSLVGTIGATFAGRTIVSNLLKMIPGVGTAVGGAISGTTASLLTTALGESYIQVMKMIVTGEINENDLKNETVQNQIKTMFEERLKQKNN